MRYINVNQAIKFATRGTDTAVLEKGVAQQDKKVLTNNPTYGKIESSKGGQNYERPTVEQR